MPAEGRKCVWTWQSGLVVLIWGAFACRTSAQSIEDSASGSQLRFPEPGPNAEVVLWEQRGFSGRSVRLECCGETDLQAPLKAAGLRSLQSVSVTAGLHAVFYTRPYRFSASGASRSFDAFGNLSSLMDIFPLSEETCCSSVRVSKAARLHDEETSVFVYSDEGFRGEVAAYAEGDHGGLPFSSIGSARVPAGFRASFHYGTSFGSVFSEPDIVLNRDSHRFPDEDTSTTKNKRRLSSIPVQGISVRRVQPEHLHGLFVYFEPGFRGRAQFLGAGEHYNYPDSWSQVKSLRPTNWTYGRLLTSQGPSEIHEPTEGLEGNQTQPHAIEVKARCEPEDYCGRNGRCTAPQRCSCEGDFTGSRCHLMEPDGTSAIVCEHNAIVLGEALACWLLPRHENAPCNASSVLVRVDLAEELAGSAELFGSPLIKGRWGVVKVGQEDYDSDAFRFEAVFNKTGRFQEPVSLTVLRRPVAGAHVPQLEVLERCDRPDAAAAVRCGPAEDVGGQSRHNCTLSTTLGGAPLRCPRRALRLQLLGKGGRQEPLQLQGEDLGPASDSFAFSLDATQARPGFKRTRFGLEVSHGADAQVVPIIMVQAKKEQAPLPSHSVRARELLQRGDVAGAMALLEACKGTPSCLRLRAELLSRLGRFAEAERTYNTLGDTRHSSRLAAARAATAAVVAATERGDYEAAKRDLQPALEAAPLSARLWVLSAEAALQEGDFDLAADRARHAHRLGGVAAAEARRSIDVSTLEALGFALLGIGLADVAQQNFLGCAELEGASAGEHHRLLASEVASLRSAARLLDEKVRAEAWTSAAPLAERLIQEHGARWPAFSESLWNLQAQSALCRARGSLRANRTDLALDSVLGPCNAVVQARTAMLVRLPLEQLLRCHVTLAEALEDTGDAAAALLQADAAEALVNTAAEGELLEALSSEVKLLRARLTKTVRRRPKAKQEGRQPTNHYEVLGIPRDATAAQVKSAYRRLALKYHPDKNPDPEAVQIFLDVQQAYQVLADETLRKLYDEGHTVDEEAGAKNVKPMRYRVRIDRLRGVKVVWWYDPSTGEEGFMEIPLTKDEMRFETPKKPGHRELRKHCCLPSSDEAGAAKG